MFYFAVGMQVGATILLFIQHEIDRGVIKMVLPASIFSTFYPLFVLLLAPFFSHLWDKLKEKKIDVSTPSKVVIGIFLAGLGICGFALAAATQWVLVWIIIGYLLLSAGELALTPAVYAAISNLSPEGTKSTMMGCWFLFVALGGYLSGLLAKASNLLLVRMAINGTGYFWQFSTIATLAFIVAIVLLLCIPSLQRLMK
jgi:POT family proton-dependent oligopeptide transporter